MKFDPASVPDGCLYRPVPFSVDRPLIEPRSIFAHTMAATVRSSVQSAWNFANAKPHSNTLPHYALGLDEKDGCAKFLATNRRGIANATVKEFEGEHGDISWWSLAIETADTGSLADPTISAFTDYQLEMLTRIYVHEARGWVIPAIKLPYWWGAGMATHTDPFGYPFTTLYRGKICPGAKKKAQFWAEVLPEVQRRLAPKPAPIPPEDDDDMLINNDILADIDSAPPVSAMNQDPPDVSTSRWFQASVIAAMFKQLTGSKTYTQAAAERLNALLKD